MSCNFQDLTLSSITDLRLDTNSFVPLKSLTALKSLHVDRAALSSVGFWDAIRNNSSIANLICHAGGDMNAVMSESLASLAELKALDFPNVRMHARNEGSIYLAPRLTQLTKLSIKVNGALASDLSCLTNLMHLELQIHLEFDCSLEDTLVQMPRLERLVVKEADRLADGTYLLPVLPRYEKLRISSGAMQQLQRLKSLSLESVTVHEFFFQELTSLVKLTKLEVENVGVFCVESVISQIHQLEHLEELKLLSRDQSRVCSVLSPEYLPKLTKLTVPSSAEVTDTLRRRFRCRPQVLINRTKTSQWHGQLSG